MTDASHDPGGRIPSAPAAGRAADTVTRIWGLIVVAVGVWFLLDVTFGFEMPRIPWRELWPVAVIGVGLAILVRGMRSAR